MAAGSGIATDSDAVDFSGYELELLELESDCEKLEEELRTAEADVGVATAQFDDAEGNLRCVSLRITALQDEHRTAKEEVMGLTRAQLNEVKSLRTNPPPVVRRALESVWVVLKCQQWPKGEALLQALDFAGEWPKIQRMLTNDTFVQNVCDFDSAELDKVPWVVHFLVNSYFPDLRTPQAQIARPDTIDIVCRTPSNSSAAGLARSPSNSSVCMSPSNSTNAARPSSSPSSPVVAKRKSVSSAFKSAGLAAVGGRGPPRPLDLETVQRANLACGVLVRWCIRVVREFNALRDLRLESAEASERVVANAANVAIKKEAAADCGKRLESARLKRDALQENLMRLRQQQLEAARARAQLARLQHVQKMYGIETAGTCDAAARRARQRENVKTQPLTLGDFIEELKASKQSPPEISAATREASGVLKADKVATQSDDLLIEGIHAPVSQSVATTTTDVASQKRLSDRYASQPDDFFIVIDAAAPLALPATDPQKEAPEAPPPEWWIECGYNEAEVCKRGSTWYREQQKACQRLANFLKAQPHVVVFIEGYTSGSDEDKNIGKRRAESLAAWLIQNGAVAAQVRLDLPASQTPVQAEQLKAKAADESEQEESDCDSSCPTRRPNRCIVVRTLREVRISDGGFPIGDMAQREQRGFFFAPEDAALDSLGDELPKMLWRVAQELQRIFTEEGRRLLLVEGHADEGIEDPGLLHFLAQRRADAVRNFIFDLIGERKPSKEKVVKGFRSSRSQLDLATRRSLGAEKGSNAPPVMLRPEDVCTLSRGKDCRVTQEYGQCGLNRRVHLFLL